nr:hypothetical protein [Arthrobacter sp. JCM 19049]
MRVFARVALARPGFFENGRHKAQMIEDGIRGFRNFISPILPYAEVMVHVAGQDFKVHADRGGVIDAKLSVDLAPGWHRWMSVWPRGKEPAPRCWSLTKTSAPG